MVGDGGMGKPRLCSKGCGRLARPGPLGKHEKRCFRTIEELFEYVCKGCKMEFDKRVGQHKPYHSHQCYLERGPVCAGKGMWTA